MNRWLQGVLVWAAALACAWLLPGSLWKAAQPPPFPAAFLTPGALALGILILASLAAAGTWGPAASKSRALNLWEALPDLLWGAGLLALRPAAWGPPGYGAWLAALVAAALPGEIRWLTQALPAETPFPLAWGRGTLPVWRARGLARLVPAWLAARLPVWITATLVLERLLNVQGLGTDWMGRVAARDHAGLAAWVGFFALAWGTLEFHRRRSA